MGEAKVLVPAGMLGAGFTGAALDRGIALGASAIAIDGGSTDSGPAYLGRAMPKMPAEAIAADLRLMLVKAAPARIPVIVGSAGTSGTDAGVDWVADMVETIALEEGLSPGRGTDLQRAGSRSHRRAPGRREGRRPPAGPRPDARAHRPVRPHRWAARRGAFHRRARRRCGRRCRRPGDRHGGPRRRPSSSGVPSRSDLARRQDGRVRRAVHDQPPRRRRAHRHRRRRLHRRAPRPRLCLHDRCPSLLT